MRSPEAKQVLGIVEQIKPLLAGREPSVQGAVLAELLALWLAGHLPSELREVLLSAHIEAVRGLTKVNAKILHGE